jgi:tRNA threonylcarbamoyladenosine biosynthesis protein TsaB
MRILALETSGNSGSVAALDASQLVLELPLASGSRSAQSLAPGIKSLLAEIGWSVGQVDLIAVTQGPGSFTGLRIGITTAKALAYAVGAQVIGVNTLEAIARQTPAARHTPAMQPALWTVLDAQRGELFAARFVFGTLDRRSAPAGVQVIDRHAWLAQLAAGELVSGPALQRSVLGIPLNVTIVDNQFWQPKAESVGRLGHEQMLAGRHDDLFQLSPQYFRQAAAEEQWRRQHDPAG